MRSEPTLRDVDKIAMQVEGIQNGKWTDCGNRQADDAARCNDPGQLGGEPFVIANVGEDRSAIHRIEVMIIEWELVSWSGHDLTS